MTVQWKAGEHCESFLTPDPTLPIVSIIHKSQQVEREYLLRFFIL